MPGVKRCIRQPCVGMHATRGQTLMHLQEDAEGCIEGFFTSLFMRTKVRAPHQQHMMSSIRGCDPAEMYCHICDAPPPLPRCFMYLYDPMAGIRPESDSLICTCTTGRLHYTRHEGRGGGRGGGQHPHPLTVNRRPGWQRAHHGLPERAARGTSEKETTSLSAAKFVSEFFCQTKCTRSRSAGGLDGNERITGFLHELQR